MTKMRKTMRNKKQRRHGGRCIIKIYNPVECPYERVFWDDWKDPRDGFRDFFQDGKLICKNSHKYVTNELKNMKLKQYYKIRCVRQRQARLRKDGNV